MEVRHKKTTRIDSPLVLSEEDCSVLRDGLKVRFGQNVHRHRGLDWADVEARIAANPSAMSSLNAMEQSGGEPDVAGYDSTTDEFFFIDCSKETPKGRVSVCYDRAGLESRKEHRPTTSAIDMAAEMRIDLMTEAEYASLQELGEFDLKTSSWLKTPPELRGLGGAIYGERRYGRVFVGHNGAQSYFGVRGFRGILRV